jgi:hypothetical protein
MNIGNARKSYIVKRRKYETFHSVGTLLGPFFVLTFLSECGLVVFAGKKINHQQLSQFNKMTIDLASLISGYINPVLSLEQ